MQTQFNKGELVLKLAKSKGKCEPVILVTSATPKNGAIEKVYFEKG
jgi:hypothetical protein